MSTLYPVHSTCFASSKLRRQKRREKRQFVKSIIQTIDTLRLQVANGQFPLKAQADLPFLDPTQLLQRIRNNIIKKRKKITQPTTLSKYLAKLTHQLRPRVAKIIDAVNTATTPADEASINNKCLMASMRPLTVLAGRILDNIPGNKTEDIPRNEDIDTPYYEHTMDIIALLDETVKKIRGNGYVSREAAQKDAQQTLDEVTKHINEYPKAFQLIEGTDKLKNAGPVSSLLISQLPLLAEFTPILAPTPQPS